MYLKIFGEGSFDKGFYFYTTALFYPDFRTGNISFGLHPLQKMEGLFYIDTMLLGILNSNNKSVTRLEPNIEMTMKLLLKLIFLYFICGCSSINVNNNIAPGYIRHSVHQYCYWTAYFYS